MKSFIALWLLWASILFCPGVYAQKKDIVPLQPGDTVPPSLMSYILPHIFQEGSGILPELILVPFWSYWCSSSKQLLPRLQNLQAVTGSRLAVLPVTSDPTAHIDSMRQQMPGLPGKLLTGDTLLRSYFPYAMVPHVVWLQRSGRVAAITSGEVITAQSVASLLAGEATSLPLKQDVIGFNPDAPLLITEQPLRYHSLIMPYHPGLPGQMGYQWDSSRRSARVYAINMGLPALYSLAFAHIKGLDPNRWRWLLKDTTRLHFNGSPEEKPAWNAQNHFSYELNLPETPIEKLAPAVQQDLDRFFGFQSRLEWRKVPCWVLTAKKDVAAYRTKGGKSGANFGAAGVPKYLRNRPIKSLVKYLNSRADALPVLDETGFEGHVDLKLPDDLWNMKALQEALAAQGLELKLKKRKLLFVTIRDSP